MCHDFTAVHEANMLKQHLLYTGIGAAACPRHGCFVPHSVVDFQKGERYVLCLSRKFWLPNSHQVDKGIWTSVSARLRSIIWRALSRSCFHMISCANSGKISRNVLKAILI